MYDKRILNQKLAPEGGWRTIRKPGLKENIAPERKNLYFHPGRGGVVIVPTLSKTSSSSVSVRMLNF